MDPSNELYKSWHLMNVVDFKELFLTAQILFNIYSIDFFIHLWNKIVLFFKKKRILAGDFLGSLLVLTAVCKPLLSQYTGWISWISSHADASHLYPFSTLFSDIGNDIFPASRCCIWQAFTWTMPKLPFFYGLWLCSNWS